MLVPLFILSVIVTVGLSWLLYVILRDPTYKLTPAELIEFQAQQRFRLECAREQMREEESAIKIRVEELRKQGCPENRKKTPRDEN